MAQIDQNQVDESYLLKAGEILSPIKSASYQALNLPASRTMLDVGCGPGIDCANIARLLPPGGRVTGVDFDPRMIAAAEASARQQGLSETLTYQQANACELPFADNSFCATRSERLLMHLDTPDTALREMVRVTRPGGRLVVIDSDWASLSCATGDDVIERRICHYLASTMLPNGYSGRNLPGQFNTLPLTNITTAVQSFTVTEPGVWRLMGQLDQVEASAIAAGVVTSREIEQWHNCIQQHFQQGKFHATLNLTMVAGSKHG